MTKKNSIILLIIVLFVSPSIIFNIIGCRKPNTKVDSAIRSLKDILNTKDRPKEVQDRCVDAITKWCNHKLDPKPIFIEAYFEGSDDYQYLVFAFSDEEADVVGFEITTKMCNDNFREAIVSEYRFDNFLEYYSDLVKKKAVFYDTVMIKDQITEKKDDILQLTDPENNEIYMRVFDTQGNYSNSLKVIWKVDKSGSKTNG